MKKFTINSDFFSKIDELVLFCVFWVFAKIDEIVLYEIVLYDCNLLVSEVADLSLTSNLVG
jgi:hypothetical protein